MKPPSNAYVIHISILTGSQVGDSIDFDKQLQFKLYERILWQMSYEVMNTFNFMKAKWEIEDELQRLLISKNICTNGNSYRFLNESPK